MPKLPEAPRKPDKLEDKPPEEVANKAAEAMVKLVLEGKPLEKDQVAQQLWRACRLEGDGSHVRPFFRSILEGPVYAKLLEIKMRRVTLTSVEEVTFLKDIARDLAKLSGDALIEDLLIHPRAISASTKQQILRQTADIYEKLSPKQPSEQGEPEAPTLESVAVEQASEFEEALGRLPESLKERRVRQWKLNEMQRVNEEEKRLLGLGQPDETIDRVS